MALDINWYRNLSEKEKRSCIEKLEQDHREISKLHQDVKKMYERHLAEEKTSGSDMASIIRHYDQVKLEKKAIEDDMALISAYTYRYSLQGSASDIIYCVVKDPVTAVKSILGNGTVHIRPTELCQEVAVGTMTFKQIREERNRRIEAKDRGWWARQHSEFNRAAKKEEVVERKEKEQKAKEAQ